MPSESPYTPPRSPSGATQGRREWPPTKVLHRLALVTVALVAAGSIRKNFSGPARDVISGMIPYGVIALWGFLLWKLAVSPRRWALPAALFILLMIGVQTYLILHANEIQERQMDEWLKQNPIIIHREPIVATNRIRLDPWRILWSLAPHIAASVACGALWRRMRVSG